MSAADNERPLMKDALGPGAVRDIASVGSAVSLDFDSSEFVEAASSGLAGLSVMERVRQIADALKPSLPDDYTAALAIIRKMVPELTHQFQAIALTEFVARHGTHSFDASLAAIAELTRYGTGEFAIRPFLDADPSRTLRQMELWAQSEDEHVRRLASEGSRPRLPWATRIAALKKDPTLAMPILDVLKSDPSPYVQRSVANHLNDISKDRPDWLVERLGSWSQEEAATRWIIRHALRTLIKQGHTGALALIGVSGTLAVEVSSFTVSPERLKLGDKLVIEVTLASLSADIQRLVVDYRVRYVRSSGKKTDKVFKLKTLDVGPTASVSISIKQRFQDFSTRRHYPGIHEVELLVNGTVMAAAKFDLLGAGG